MKILTIGHKYELANFENADSAGQTIQFIEKIPEAPDSTVLKTVNDGTTNEEVLAVMIDRMQSLQEKFPCTENIGVIANLQEALVLLNRRTADRKARSVEGKQIA